ncbi:hypothetical protein OKA04_07515 [Luteolibacter flavescens]|uniref:Uncharacterized protein n=1 Tax=Luteolibacter flavescens TaxID=1859460 RepID=A0ABT3FLX2_9BACT|nr:hypothetical protein [Luteolibacter flavescens]MCW1884576.1 hypothetical protein [Luteolibacter flavescens]
MLIIASIACAPFLPSEWLPRLPGLSLDWFGVMLSFAIPMAAILLFYEIGRVISSTLARRRMAKASDQEFLERLSRHSRRDHTQR